MSGGRGGAAGDVTSLLDIVYHLLQFFLHLEGDPAQAFIFDHTHGGRRHDGGDEGLAAAPVDDDVAREHQADVPIVSPPSSMLRVTFSFSSASRGIVVVTSPSTFPSAWRAW